MRYFTAQIKMYYPDAGYVRLPNWVKGRSWQDCREQFTSFVLDWLLSWNSMRAMAVYRSVLDGYLAGKTCDHFNYFGEVILTIRKMK